MKTLKHFSKWTLVFYNGFHSFINFILGTAIILQILIFVVESNDYKIQIPEFLLTTTRNLLLEKQISFEAKDITLKLTGEVYLEDLKINYAHFTEPLITCDHLKCHLNLISLMFGKLQPEKLLIKNATFFLPSSLAPSGLHEPFVKNFFGAINFGKRYTQIEQLNFNCQNLSVTAEGSWSNRQYPFNFQDIDISDYLPLSTTLSNIKTQLSSLEEPILTIHIKENEKKLVIFDSSIAASRLSMNTINLGRFHINSELIYQHPKIVLNKPLEIYAENINWKNNTLLAKSAQSALIIDPNIIITNPQSALKNLRLSLNEITTHNLDIDSAEITCDLTNHLIIPLSISALHHNNWVSITGNFNSEQLSMHGFTKGSSNLNELKSIVAQFINQTISEQELSGRINWRGQFEVSQNNGLHIDKSKLAITSQELNYNNIKANEVYAEINLNSNELNIPYISIEGGENYAKGSIFQDFKTGDYRYLLTGAIIPESLNSCLGNWWKELISKFEFSSPMPFGNMDVRGNLSDTTKWIVFGEIQANNFIYSDIPIKELSLRINSNEKELELIDLHVNSINGNLDAYTRFEYSTIPPHKEIIYTFVNGSSSLALNELDTIIGVPSIHNVLSEFSSESTPLLNINGEIYNNNKADTQINIQCTTNNPISYHNIPFENLAFTSQYTPTKILINNITAGFAKGQASGSLTITPTQNPTKPTINTNIHLASVNQEMAVNFLQPLWKQPEQKNKKANNYGGLINLDLETAGTLGDWNSFTGSGKISITQATLGKIHLLWILSEILSPLMPLGLGSLHLTDANSDFLIRDGTIHFPNINIYGSTVSIDGEGNFYLGSQKLDFILDISPMNKNGIPIISQALLVLTPITQSFQMHLGGTLYEPLWETTLTPLGLFKKKGPGLPSKN